MTSCGILVQAASRCAARRPFAARSALASYSALAVLAALVLACAPAARVSAQTLGDADAARPSYANLGQFRLTHLDLSLDVDFRNQELDGKAALTLQRLDPQATQLVLDTQGLDVLDVSMVSNDIVGATKKPAPLWVTLPFRIGRADLQSGARLVIDLPTSTAPSEIVKIEYETTSASAALDWRVPASIDRKHRPFVYTRADAGGARSWIPLQDAPSVAMTYRVRVHTGEGLQAVMAVANEPPVKRGGEYVFDMPTPVNPDLMALAVGDFEFKPLGSRTGVYAPAARMAAAVEHFADAEALLTAAETLLGPYPWKRDDQLVMGASFPLTSTPYPGIDFVSPTRIAGPRRSAGENGSSDPVATGIAAGWAGGLVRATPRDRWFDAGWSRYLGGRFMTVVYGERPVWLGVLLDYRANRAALADCVLNDSADGSCPEAAALKASLLMSFLESRFGRARFDAFQRDYFAYFAHRMVSFPQFLAYLEERLLAPNPGVVSNAEIDAWISAGLPADAVLPQASLLDGVDAVRRAFVSGTAESKALDKRPEKSPAVQAWSTAEWIAFIDGLPPHLEPAEWTALDRALASPGADNPEVQQRWLIAALRADYRPALARLEPYLKAVGVERLIVPLYAELVKTPAGTQMAKRIYTAARPGYDRETVASVDGLVTAEMAVPE
jgi:hypothetical protein